MHSLNPVQKVGAQILEALQLHVTDRWKNDKARAARVRELLAAVDLPLPKAQSFPHELSGGRSSGS